MPYSFAYGVKDDYKGTYFDRNERSSGDKIVGSYTVQLPDGRIQMVRKLETIKIAITHYKIVLHY